MKRHLLLLGFLFLLIAPTLHAQVVGGDPMNNTTVCSAEMSGTDCAAAGFGSTGSSSTGGSSTTICRSGTDSSTYCFTPTFDRYGRQSLACNRGYVGTGYCTCYKGVMAGSCGVQR